MKFQHSVIVNKPLDEVVRYFLATEHLGQYQDGFLRKEQVAGEPGMEGAIANLFYEYGKKEMSITEHIQHNNLPDAFEAYYHHSHMENTLIASFRKIANDQTEYHAAYEYIRIDWVMPKLMSLLFPSVYKKPPLKWMKQFKEFVESQ